jgi:hypothetical protein
MLKDKGLKIKCRMHTNKNFQAYYDTDLNRIILLNHLKNTTRDAHEL